MTRRNCLAARPRLERLDERLLLSALTPAQIDSAYGLKAVTFSNGAIQGNGKGQTIAIIDAYHDPAIYGDLVAFDAKYNLPNPTLTANLPSKTSVGSQPAFSMVNFAGSTTNSGWEVEEALDVEMAHAAAPEANIVLVEAKTSGLFDLLSSITAVKTLPSVSVISMSWGGPEFNGQQQFDSTFTTPVGHTGITFLASSGDNGAGAQWPASSPNVVGVGGTSLVVASTGARSTESAWSGSGGGISQFAPLPSYQAKVVTGKFRSSPDVAVDADPGTGLVIVSGGSQMDVGGTSLSSPIFAGLIAVADQGLDLAKGTTLDGATQTLPDLYKAPAGSFYDVTTGTRATVGYDVTTGLGTPNASTLVPFLDGTTSVTTNPNGGGTTTHSSAIGGSISAGPSLAFPVSGPAITSPGSTSEPTGTQATGWMSLLPNLVALNPVATDSALADWDLFSGSAASQLATGRREAGAIARG